MGEKMTLRDVLDGVLVHVDGIAPYAEVPVVDLQAWADTLTTHLTQPAQAVDGEDADRWRYLVRENNKGGRGAFRICWFDERGDLCTSDGVSIDGKDEQAIVRIIDEARLTAALPKDSNAQEDTPDAAR